MFEVFGLNMKQIYPALVVSTMSSGKSTLINAIIGKELLPVSPLACTAKAVAVLDNNVKRRYGMHVVDGEGKYYFMEEATSKAVAEYNKASNENRIIIEGDIQGIRNCQKALLLVDTPGLNYCMDQMHEMITKEVLDEYQKGLILYVMNAQQIGTYDEIDALKMIASKIKDNSDFTVIFVINKMDAIDPDKEKPDELVERCRECIRDQGINNPVLIPVSAGSALLFKKIINKEYLSQTEEEDFERSYNSFKRNGYSLVDYVNIPERRSGKEIIVIDNKKYVCAEIYAALDNTGLPFLEKKIYEVLVGSSKVEVPKITIKRLLERRVKKELIPVEWQKKRAEKKTVDEKIKVEKKIKKEK